MITDSQFAGIVLGFVQALDRNRRELADQFEATLTAVDRWSLGLTVPIIKDQVVAWIRNQG